MPTKRVFPVYCNNDSGYFLSFICCSAVCALLFHFKRTTHCLKPMGFLLHRPRNLLSPQALIRTVPALFIFFLMLFALFLLPVYFLQHLYPCHVPFHISDISISSPTNLLCPYSDTHKQNIFGCWHKMYLF